MARVLLVGAKSQDVSFMKGFKMLLQSTGQIAEVIGQDRDRVSYAIRKTGVRTVGRAGLLRLFPQSAVGTVQEFLKSRQGDIGMRRDRRRRRAARSFGRVTGTAAGALQPGDYPRRACASIKRHQEELGAVALSWLHCLDDGEAAGRLRLLGAALRRYVGLRVGKGVACRALPGVPESNGDGAESTNADRAQVVAAPVSESPVKPGDGIDREPSPSRCHSMDRQHAGDCPQALPASAL